MFTLGSGSRKEKLHHHETRRERYGEEEGVKWEEREEEEAERTLREGVTNNFRAFV